MPRRLLGGAKWRRWLVVVVFIAAVLLLLPYCANSSISTSSGSSSISATDGTDSSSLSSLLPPQLPPHRDRPPNFIVLFMDDLGYGDVGFNGHPSIQTPNLDQLAYHGKILTSWYSACPVCSGSRASLLTGRQFPRIGTPGVYEPVGNAGMPLSEITIAQHLRQSQWNYTTAIVGKWHLGQRTPYLPIHRGFDYYLGIPFSVDMGQARASPCPHTDEQSNSDSFSSRFARPDIDDDDATDDPARHYLPLVYQDFVRHVTQILEQPLDLTHLMNHYQQFVTRFIQQHRNVPFFLYVPFSHVHVTSNSQPHQQYSGCDWRHTSRRGAFGDALEEADALVGTIMAEIRRHDDNDQLEDNTLILFTSDNGPWLQQGLSAGSVGLLTGQYANYTNTAKGSTWEGGIRMPAFAYWKNTIPPFSRSAEVMSSLDVFPTLSHLAGLDLPHDDGRIYDGRDASNILLHRNGSSPHEFLFFYGNCHARHNGSSSDNGHHRYTVTAARHGPYKAHWCTGPGLGGDTVALTRVYEPYPLLFHIEHDPSESQPIGYGGHHVPDDPEHAEALHRLVKAHAFEVATFVYGDPTPEPDGPGEGPGRYGVCCDRSKACLCDPIDPLHVASAYMDNGGGLGAVGSQAHHDAYHAAMGDPESPSPLPGVQRHWQEQEDA